MLRKLPAILSLMLLMHLGLVACGEDGRQAETPGPVAVVSAHPGATPTATLIASSATVTRVPPSATPPPPTPSATLPPPTPSMTPPPSTPSTAPQPAQPTDTPAPTSPPVPSTPLPTPSQPIVANKQTDLAAVRLELQRVVGSLDTPIGIAHAGDGSGRLFIVEKKGRIRVVQGGALADVPFLDVTDRVGSSQSEQGLLGLAFHPDYLDNGLFFVNYTDLQGDTVVSRFAVSADPGQADASSEAILLTLDQPAGNHNGGHLAFGPDGYLYIGTGDGGGAGDQFGNGQNGQTLLGAMLRLDVDHGSPYAVPADNPFVGDPAIRDEIWAIGLRNPWRYSFDRRTGDLYIADVGQNLYEEVNVQPASSPGGQNYGWPIMEAAQCYPENQTCDQAGLTLPVTEYDHALGCSVTGGYVYRGQENPLLTGVYLFGDFCTGRIWGLVAADDGQWQAAEMAQSGLQISSLGQDEGGELYVLDMGQGSLYKVAALPR